MNRIHIIAPLSALSRRTRLFKLTKFIFQKTPHTHIVHVGWERNLGEREEIYLKEFNIHKKIILTGGGYGGNKVKLLYIAWIIGVFLYCLKLTKKDKVWALGFESAFPAMLAGKIKRFDVIFDDADRFSMIIPIPRLLKSIVEFLEKITSQKTKAHVIPGIERYDFHSKKFYTLKNTPSLNELDAAKKIFKEREWPKAKLVINVNGWLGAGRGMDSALEVAKSLQSDGLIILLAGKIDCPAALELSKLSNVHYLGSISNSEALASYYASDFVLTYYAPESKINCYAESNKWGDAIKTGIGVIVNSEVFTANYLRTGGAALSFPYHDHTTLIEKLRYLIKNPEQKDEYKRNSSNLSSHFGYFEDQLEKLSKETQLV